MENTLENKEKFFAQYLHTEAIIVTAVSGCYRLLDSQGYDINFKSGNREQWFSIEDLYNISQYIEKSYLELKPLSLLTKEDRFNMGRIMRYDYLRSKGYALPWMGLSVEELVNRGWVKLKEPNNE